MDLHKPKPWHGWRDFLKEFGTIVLGVSVALAAEQGVEWLHWQGEVKAARQAIRAEMAAANIGYFAFRLAIAPCMERKMGESQAAIDALQARRKPQPLAGFRTGIGALLSDAEWQSERASQVLTHFPRDELALMNTYYAAMQGQGESLAAERAAWSELSVLQDVPAGIAASDIIRLRVNLEMARRMEFGIERTARRVLDLSRQLGLSETKLDPPRLAAARNFCSNMSLEDFRRWQNSPQAPEYHPPVP